MLGLVVADLRRHAAGVFVVALIVALASALGVTVTLSERALRLGSARAASAFDLVVGAPGSETQLVLSAVFLQPAPLPLMPGHVLADLRADPRVAFAAPVGFGDFAGNDPIVGTTADAVAALGRIGEGRVFERMGEAVAGAAVDRPLGAKFHPLHGRASEGGHPHARTEYRIVGRMAPTGTPFDHAVLVPIQAVWKAHEREADEAPLLSAAHGDHAGAGAGGPDALLDAARLADPRAPGVPAILVKPKTFADAYKLRQEYRSDRTLAVFPAEVLTRLYGTLGDARTILAAVAAGAQALVASAVLLTVVAHVLGRKRQIGALRALGAPRGSVFAIVWLEVFAVTALGILGGFGLGRAAAAVLARIAGGTSGIALPVEFHREDLTSLVVLLAASGLATLVPALLAYRQSPANALRG